MKRNRVVRQCKKCGKLEADNWARHFKSDHGGADPQELLEGERFLSDQTKIANTTWANLKRLAQEDDYQKKTWFVSLKKEEKQLLEMLIAAQIAQRDQFELQTRHSRVFKFWWEQGKPGASLSEDKLNIGPPTAPLRFIAGQTEMITFIKSQLRLGIRVPWRYREFGAVAVEEMFDARDPIGRSHKSGGKDLLSPTESDLSEYAFKEIRIFNPHFTRSAFFGKCVTPTKKKFESEQFETPIKMKNSNSKLEKPSDYEDSSETAEKLKSGRVTVTFQLQQYYVKQLEFK